jgi:hypothetical protein
MARRISTGIDKLTWSKREKSCDIHPSIYESDYGEADRNGVITSLIEHKTPLLLSQLPEADHFPHSAYSLIDSSDRNIPNVPVVDSPPPSPDEDKSLYTYAENLSTLGFPKRVFKYLEPDSTNVGVDSPTQYVSVPIYSVFICACD